MMENRYLFRGKRYDEPYFKTLTEGQAYFFRQGTHWPVNEELCMEFTNDDKANVKQGRTVNLAKMMRDVRTNAKESGKENKLAELVFSKMAV